jgi:hypothetical protein
MAFFPGREVFGQLGQARVEQGVVQRSDDHLIFLVGQLRQFADGARNVRQRWVWAKGIAEDVAEKKNLNSRLGRIGRFTVPLAPIPVPRRPAPDVENRRERDLSERRNVGWPIDRIFQDVGMPTEHLPIGVGSFPLGSGTFLLNSDSVCEAFAHLDRSLTAWIVAVDPETSRAGAGEEAQLAISRPPLEYFSNFVGISTPQPFLLGHGQTLLTM